MKLVHSGHTVLHLRHEFFCLQSSLYPTYRITKNLGLGQVSLAVFFKNRHGYIYKTSISVKVVGVEVVSIQENYFQ